MNKYSKLSIRTIARFFYQFFKGYFFKKEKLKKRIYIPPFQRFTHECTIFLNSSNERGERGNGQKKQYLYSRTSTANVKMKKKN